MTSRMGEVKEVKNRALFLLMKIWMSNPAFNPAIVQGEIFWVE